MFIEEEISISVPRMHKGCGKKLFFTEELISLVSAAGFEMVNKKQKDEKAIYLLFEK